MSDRRDGPRAGDVWRYPYLWARQASKGETEGRKPRPCAMAFLVRREDGLEHALLLAITSQEPADKNFAIEVPEIEKRRANLDHDIPLWIILSERNEDTPAQSFYFEPQGKIGTFSASFTKEVQVAKIAALKSRRSRGVSRLD